MHMWDVVFGVLNAPFVEAHLASCPALRDVKRQREAAGLGFQLHARGGYTDDVRHRYVGPGSSRCGAKAWFIVTHGFNVMMAEAEKRQLAVHDLSLGTHTNLSLGIAYVEEDRVARIVAELDLLTAGLMTVEAYRSLMGKLIHLSFLANMSRSSTHGMFAPLAPNGALRHGPATLIAGDYLSPLLVRRAGEWRHRISTSAGAPLVAAVPQLTRWRPLVPARVRRFWRSDSCKEGTSTPGIAGVCNDVAWIRPLTPEEADLLPVPVTEFVGYYGNLRVFGDDAAAEPDVRVSSEIDALTPSFVLTTEAAQSELMHKVLEDVQADPAFRLLRKARPGASLR